METQKRVLSGLAPLLVVALPLLSLSADLPVAAELAASEQLVLQLEVEPETESERNALLSQAKRLGVVAVEFCFSNALRRLSLPKVLQLVRRTLWGAREQSSVAHWVTVPLSYQFPTQWLAQVAIESRAHAVMLSPNRRLSPALDVSTMATKPRLDVDERSRAIIELHEQLGVLTSVRGEMQSAAVGVTTGPLPPEHLPAAIASGAFSVRLDAAETLPHHLDAYRAVLSGQVVASGLPSISEFYSVGHPLLRQALHQRSVVPRQSHRPRVAAARSGDRKRAVILTAFPHALHLAQRALEANSVDCAGVVIAHRSFGHENPGGGLTAFEGPATAPILVATRMREATPFISSLEPDFLIAYHFPWKVPNDVLKMARLAALNVHPSLLPDYPGGQGGSAIGWGIANDDPELGATAHRMTEQYDQGEILGQSRFPNSPELQMWDVMLECESSCCAAMTEAISAVLEGRPGRHPIGAGGRPAPAFDAAYRQVNWIETAQEIQRKVRALAYSAKATIAGQAVTLNRVRPLPGGGTEGATPGTVLSRGMNRMTVQCGGNTVLEVLDFDVVADDPG